MILVVATTLATGLVTVVVAWQQNRFAVKRAEAARVAARSEAYRVSSREHALTLHRALEQLQSMGMEAQRGSGELPENEDIRPFTQVARENYLLVSDRDLRVAVADGLTLLASARARGVLTVDWTNAAAAASFVVAAYLRGDELPDGYVSELSELRERYPLVK